MKLKPMADNVLLKQYEAPETTFSGIVLATATKEKPAIYEVVSAGPGTKDVAMTVAAGDRVVVAKHCDGICPLLNGGIQPYFSTLPGCGIFLLRNMQRRA